jgi:hypothetical protein
MNSVELGLGRRWDPSGITRTSGLGVIELFLAALLMFAPPNSAEAEQCVTLVAENSASPLPQLPPETHADPGGRAEGFVVLVSSQRSEENAQAAYEALKRKHPTLLAERALIIKRADLGDKGVYYRAVVGPFDTAAEAAQFCNRLRTAGVPCIVQRN